MKRIRIFTMVVVIMGLAGCATDINDLTSDISRQLSAKDREIKLAVVGFDNKQVALKLTTLIVNQQPENTVVLSRTLLEPILKEFKFQFSDLFDAEKRAALGRHLGANAVLVGDEFAQDAKSVKELFVIDVETAELLAASTAFMASEDEEETIAAMLKRAASKDVATIAVVGFNPDKEPSPVDAIRAEAAGRIVTAAITKIKNRDNLPLTIVSRFKIQAVMSENRLQLSDLFDPEERATLGRFSGADSIVVVTPAPDDQVNLQLLRMDSAEVVGACDMDMAIEKTESFKNLAAKHKTDISTLSVTGKVGHFFGSIWNGVASFFKKTFAIISKIIKLMFDWSEEAYWLKVSVVLLIGLIWGGIYGVISDEYDHIIKVPAILVGGYTVLHILLAIVTERIFSS